VGDLPVGVGYRLSGRVVLSDGKPIPAGVRVHVSREEAWDSQEMLVGTDGAFMFEGLPSERFTLSADVPGYRFSPKNASSGRLNQFGLLDAVKADVTDLRLLYEPLAE
jgi:hypothetical protein